MNTQDMAEELDSRMRQEKQRRGIASSETSVDVGFVDLPDEQREPKPRTGSLTWTLLRMNVGESRWFETSEAMPTAQDVQQRLSSTIIRVNEVEPDYRFTRKTFAAVAVSDLEATHIVRLTRTA